MKILIIKKKFVVNILFIVFLMFLSSIVFYFTSVKFKTLQTIYPINISQDIKYDLNNDGKEDILQMIDGHNQVDFNIKFNNSDDYYLSKEIEDNILFTLNNHWLPKVFVHDISRDNIPELIVQGSKNNKSTCYIFNWDKQKFTNIYTTNKNIFGILDCKNTKTPQCYSLSSSEGLSSLNSFMIINNEILDTTKENLKVPSLDPAISFINLVEVPYELGDIPDIFTTSIDKSELSLLWNLDKDKYSYAFQNAFFYDYEWNDSGQPSAIKWRLSFEKNNLKGSETDKNELVLLLDLKKFDNTYKITSIQKPN